MAIAYTPEPLLYLWATLLLAAASTALLLLLAPPPRPATFPVVLRQRAIDLLVYANAGWTWAGRRAQEATQVCRDPFGQSRAAFPIAAPWFWEKDAQVRASVASASSERLRRIISLLYRTYSPPTTVDLQQLRFRYGRGDDADNSPSFILSVTDQENRAALVSIVLRSEPDRLVMQGAIRLTPGEGNTTASLPASTHDICLHDISLSAIWSAMKPAPSAAG